MSISPPTHTRELFTQEKTDLFLPPLPNLNGTPFNSDLNLNSIRFRNEFYPRFLHHGQSLSRFPDTHYSGFLIANPMETGNPHPSPPAFPGPASADQIQIGFSHLQASIEANNIPQAWLKFCEVRNSQIRIPIGILLDFIAYICHEDAFTNWPESFEKPNDVLFIIVNYLKRNNFRDNDVFDGIMLAFSRIPANEGLFRCLDLLKSLPYIPSRDTLLSIMATYTRSNLDSKLLDLFPLMNKNGYTDCQMLNAFFKSIQSVITANRNQIIDMLLFLSTQIATVLPRESYILIVEAFTSVCDITRALVVITSFPPKTQLENIHIERIIMKSHHLLIQKVFKFVEQLNDSQRSMLSSQCYASLIDKSISSNYPYGISYLFSLCINFNRLIESSLITKLLEFLFRNNHTSQVTKIFKMIESFRTSDEQNSLTNIFLPPTMHKISQLLIEHKSFINLHTFVMTMLNEKIVPLKPVIQGLVEHLKTIKDHEKVNEIFNFAVKNELVFDEHIFNSRHDTLTTQHSHFIINLDTPTHEAAFDIPMGEINNPTEHEFLISVIDRMVCTNIPHDHIFNHVLVSLGQRKDSFNIFKLLLDAFIPGDPDRPPESRTIINQILFRTAMRLTASFIFEKEWSKCINFLSLVNQTSLMNGELVSQHAKELVQFLSSVIDVSIKENNFTEVFKIFDKLNWPHFLLFDRSDIPQFKTQLISLFTQCLEQVDLHNASRVITYHLLEEADETAKSSFVQLLGVASNLGECNTALSLFTFINANKIEVTIDHTIYQMLITHLGQENRLHQAKMVFQHGVTNSCYTAMLSIMASPSQVNLFSNLVPLEIKFLLEKRLQSLYNMHKDVLTDSERSVEIEPFEISFLRNILTTNRTAFQQAIRSLILMLSEEFIPPLIDNCSEYLKNINYLKIYKIQILPKKLQQFLLQNFVADKDKPSEMKISDSPNSCTLDEDTKLIKLQLPFPDIHIKEEALEESFSAQNTKSNDLTQSAWSCEVKRCINSKLSKYYWAGPIDTKEDYNLIAKRVTKAFRESIKIPDAEFVAILTADHDKMINTLIEEEISNFATK